LIGSKHTWPNIILTRSHVTCTCYYNVMCIKHEVYTLSIRWVIYTIWVIYILHIISITILIVFLVLIVQSTYKRQQRWTQPFYTVPWPVLQSLYFEKVHVTRTILKKIYILIICMFDTIINHTYCLYTRSAPRRHYVRKWTSDYRTYIY